MLRLYYMRSDEQQRIQERDFAVENEAVARTTSKKKRKIRMILNNMLEAEDSYEALETIISKVRKYSQQLSPLFRLSYSFLSYLSTSHNILHCQPQLIT